jgi:hypothetical protein
MTLDKEISEDAIFASLQRGAKLDELNARWRTSPPARERWEILREAYALMLPVILKQRVSPYFLDWAYNRTPIEDLAWTDIRTIGLPLYPQVPALHYFLDFADPVKKLAVELDGAAFHEHSRDMARDKVVCYWLADVPHPRQTIPWQQDGYRHDHRRLPQLA